MKNPSGVSQAINKYWRAGVVSGLIIFDGLVLCVCAIDGMRFVLGGLSLVNAWRVAAEVAIDGELVGLAVAVLLFFVVALPMVVAVLSALVSAPERWPRYLRAQGRGVLTVHILLSMTIALFTATAVAMEVLSGWAKHGSLKYGFRSIWLGAVLLGKPVYAFYVSPIIRKFLVRVSADHKTKVAEVIKEVVTEESMGPEHR